MQSNGSAVSGTFSLLMWLPWPIQLNWLVQCKNGAGVLGYSFFSLRHGVLGQFSGEEQTDSGLDLSGGDGASPVVMCQSACLSGDTLEDVIHEGVHDGHSLAGYTSVWANLLEDLVDVDGAGLLSQV